VSERARAAYFALVDRQARAAAWATMLLGLVGEAFRLGAPAVQGIVDSDESLRPTVLLRSADGAPLLAVDVFAVDPVAAERAARRRRFLQAGVPEYWQIAQRPRRARFFQRSADEKYDEIPADRAGIYYSALAEEFAFPVRWAHELPGFYEMVQTFGLVTDGDGDDDFGDDDDAE